MISLIDESGECEGLGCAPIDAFPFLDGLLPSLENFDDLRMELAALSWQLGYLFTNLVEGVNGYTCIMQQIELFVIVFDLCPFLSHPLLLIECD